MDTVTEKSGAMQAGPIEITERVVLPLPRPVAEGICYTAVYAAGDMTFRAELEQRAGYRMLSVSRQGDHPTAQHQAFASSTPPLALLEPAFAAWLEQFMAECQRRYGARTTAEGR